MSAAQTGAENAQSGTENVQEAEKPDLVTVQKKAAQGLDKLTDAELQVYTEYMQQQVDQSENSPGYADNLKQMLREGLADAQAEVQRRGNEGPQFHIIDHSDTEEIENRMADAYDKAVSEKRGVTIAEETLKKYSDIAHNSTKGLIQAIKDYYDATLAGTTVDVSMENGVITIMFENDGKKKSVGWRMKPSKAATFESIRELTENAVYAYSEKNRSVEEAADIPYFHYFVNNVDLQQGDNVKSIPVKIQVREIVTGKKPGMHYYTHNLVNTKEESSGPSSEADSSRIAGNATAALTDSIRSSDENSNPQNVEAESGEKDSSPAAQNDRGEAARDTSIENGTEERSFADAQDNSGENRTEDPHPERGKLGKDGVRVCKDTDAFSAELADVGEARLNNDTGEYHAKIRRKNDGHYLAAVDFNGKRSQARTFGTAAEAAEWAAGTVDGQTKARQDAELDRHKSEKKKGPTLTEQLFGQVDPEAEAKRQKENRAAEAATQTLRERVRRLNDQINALNRLERTTGLTEEQRSEEGIAPFCGGGRRFRLQRSATRTARIFLSLTNPQVGEGSPGQGLRGGLWGPSPV